MAEAKTLIALRLAPDLLKRVDAKRKPGQTRTDAIAAMLEDGTGGPDSRPGPSRRSKAAASRPRRAKAGMPGHSETCKCGACKSMRGE